MVVVTGRLLSIDPTLCSRTQDLVSVLTNIDQPPQGDENRLQHAPKSAVRISQGAIFHGGTRDTFIVTTVLTLKDDFPRIQALPGHQDHFSLSLNIFLGYQWSAVLPVLLVEPCIVRCSLSLDGVLWHPSPVSCTAP